MVFLGKKAKEKLDANEKLDWYLARVAYEICLTRLDPKDRPKRDIKEFLLRFEETIKEALNEPKELTEEEKKQKLMYTKASWGAFFAGSRKLSRNRRRNKR